METICVVLVRDNVVDELYTFIDNKKAEEKFLEMCHEYIRKDRYNQKNTDEELEEFWLDNGYAEMFSNHGNTDCGEDVIGSVCITHSWN